MTGTELGIGLFVITLGIVVVAWGAFALGIHLGVSGGIAAEQNRRRFAIRRHIGIHDDEDVPQVDLLIHCRPELGAEEIHRRLLGP